MVGSDDFPKVFINGQFVGSYSDVNKAIEEGSFNRLVEETASLGGKKEGEAEKVEVRIKLSFFFIPDHSLPQA